MGIKIFGNSFSKHDGYVPRPSVDPDPAFFIVEKVEEVNGHVIATVRYPNCTNFEGLKILVFCNTSAEHIKRIRLLDPHFSKNGPSPFARFYPSKKGYEAARLLCTLLPRSGGNG